MTCMFQKICSTTVPFFVVEKGNKHNAYSGVCPKFDCSETDNRIKYTVDLEAPRGFVVVLFEGGRSVACVKNNSAFKRLRATCFQKQQINGAARLKCRKRNVSIQLYLDELYLDSNDNKCTIIHFIKWASLHSRSILSLLQTFLFLRVPFYSPRVYPILVYNQMDSVFPLQ